MPIQPTSKFHKRVRVLYATERFADPYSKTDGNQSGEI